MGKKERKGGERKSCPSLFSTTGKNRREKKSIFHNASLVLSLCFLVSPPSFEVCPPLQMQQSRLLLRRAKLLLPPRSTLRRELLWEDKGKSVFFSFFLFLLRSLSLSHLSGRYKPKHQTATPPRQPAPTRKKRASPPRPR